MTTLTVDHEVKTIREIAEADARYDWNGPCERRFNLRNAATATLANAEQTTYGTAWAAEILALSNPD